MGTRTSQLRGNLCKSVSDGTLYNVMVGIGEAYLPVFILAAGLGEIAAGLVATLPFLFGAVLQLLGPYGVQWLGTPRRWVVACAATQAASFVPLIVMALSGHISRVGVFAAATVYWGSALACGSAWTTFIGTIVPRRLRPRFFARRARIANLGVMLGLLAGGLTLNYAAGGEGPGGAELPWYAALFLAAALCRAGSATLLSLHTETGPAQDHRVIRGRELLSRFRHGREGRFILYMVSVTLTVQVAQPFFIPYMVEHLHFDYDHVLGLLAASFGAKGLAQMVFGRFAHRYGAVHLLWVGGVGIVPLSGLWLVSDSFWFLLAAQVVAGAMWGAYELATFLLLMETTRVEERTSLWATYNVCNASAMVGGSLIGAQVLSEMGKAPAAYATIFVASVAARAVTTLYLLRTRETLRAPLPVAIGVDAVRAGGGSIDNPIMASLSGDSPDRLDADASAGQNQA